MTMHSLRKAFGLPLALGASVLLAAAWLFGEIAEDVVNHDLPLGTIDANVAAWLHAHATSAGAAVMSVISDFGAPLTDIAIASLVALILLWRHARYWLLALVLAVAGGALLNIIIKHLIHRQRPIFEDPILTLTSYSFPSGHAMGSTLLYGMLAAIVIGHTRDWRLHALATVCASSVVAMICFSRIYLGVHYLSDVIAGFLAGVVWLGACLVAVAALYRRRV